MYDHFAITLTTARNSSMIGFGWLTGTAFDWPRPVTETRQKRLWQPLEAQLLPMRVVAVHIGQCDSQTRTATPNFPEKIVQSSTACHHSWETLNAFAELIPASRKSRGKQSSLLGAMVYTTRCTWRVINYKTYRWISDFHRASTHTPIKSAALSRTCFFFFFFFCQLQCLYLPYENVAAVVHEWFYSHLFIIMSFILSSGLLSWNKGYISRGDRYDGQVVCSSPSKCVHYCAKDYCNDDSNWLIANLTDPGNRKRNQSI